MNTKTCGTCRHYITTTEDDEFGTCARIVHMPEYGYVDATELYTDWKAGVVDGSGYHAALLCRGDFGCTLWETKEGL